jgi:hypothetical protein
MWTLEGSWPNGMRLAAGLLLEQLPTSFVPGTPNPGRGTFGWPKASCNVGGLGPGASRTIDEEGAMPMPPPVVQDGSPHGAAEALEE